MPELGDTLRGVEIGAKAKYKWHVWHACLTCGKERWVQLLRRQPSSARCHPCGVQHRIVTKPDSWASRDRHPRWRGGYHVASNGYAQVVVPLNDPFISMADERGRVYEHRLVMARSLGRVLMKEEQVHHKNGRKVDNRLENLTLLSVSAHAVEHQTELEVLKVRIRELEAALAKATDR